MRYLLAILCCLLIPSADLFAQSNSQGAGGVRDDRRPRRFERYRRYPVQPWWYSRWGWYPTPVVPPYYYATPPASVYEQSFPSPAAASIESIRSLAGPNRASLEIVVADPAADVLIEGQRTTLYGTRRYFVSPYLEPGKTYHYTVSYKGYDSGRAVESVRKVDVRGGSQVTIDFTTPPVVPSPSR